MVEDIGAKKICLMKDKRIDHIHATEPEPVPAHTTTRLNNEHTTIEAQLSDTPESKKNSSIDDTAYCSQHTHTRTHTDTHTHTQERESEKEKERKKERKRERECVCV